MGRSGQCTVNILDNRAIVSKYHIIAIALGRRLLGHIVSTHALEGELLHPAPPFDLSLGIDKAQPRPDRPNGIDGTRCLIGLMEVVVGLGWPLLLTR